MEKLRLRQKSVYSVLSLDKAIRDRISSTLHSYELDRQIENGATIEQMMRFKLLSDIGALQEYIDDPLIQKRLRHDVTVIIVGANEVSTKERGYMIFQGR